MLLPDDEFQAIYKSAQDRFGLAEPGWTVGPIDVRDLPGRGSREKSAGVVYLFNKIGARVAAP